MFIVRFPSGACRQSEWEVTTVIHWYVGHALDYRLDMYDHKWEKSWKGLSLQSGTSFAW